MARRTLSLALGLATLVLLAAPAAPADAAAPHVTFMTRNVYLGADLGPGVRATDLPGLVDAAGVILKEVDDNKFATRAKGLAAEIRSHNPHLVGLQEVALWRTGPCTKSPIPPSAGTVRYDYLKLLLGVLNKGKKRYRTVISKPEFDFEVYVNTDGDRNTAAPGCPFGSELNGRLTMRDVILARTAGVTTSNPKSATFDTLLQVRPAGVAVDVTRGWTRSTTPRAITPTRTPTSATARSARHRRGSSSRSAAPPTRRCRSSCSATSTRTSERRSSRATASRTRRSSRRSSSNGWARRGRRSPAASSRRC
jgi:hypothetical protein